MSRDAAEGGGALRPPHCVTAPYPLWHGSYPTRHNCTGAQETHHSQRIPPSIGLTPDRHPESTDAGDTHQHHPPHTTSFTIAFRHTPAYHLPHILQYPIKTSPETHKHIARKTHVTHTLHTPSHHNRITVIKCHAEEHTPLKYHLTDTHVTCSIRAGPKPSHTETSKHIIYGPMNQYTSTLSTVTQT